MTSWSSGRMPDFHSGGAGSTPVEVPIQAEWWNSIHTRLKHGRPRGHEGATPSSATNRGDVAQRKRRGAQTTVMCGFESHHPYQFHGLTNFMALPVQPTFRTIAEGVRPPRSASVGQPPYACRLTPRSSRSCDATSGRGSWNVLTIVPLSSINWFRRSPRKALRIPSDVGALHARFSG